MRKRQTQILKQYFYEHLIHTRYEQMMTQAQMARQLCMDERSYVELDHGKTGCSSLTLALFLIYVCDDPIAFLQGLRVELESEDGGQTFQKRRTPCK